MSGYRASSNASKMNGPQRTACLAKGYVDNKPTKSLIAFNSGFAAFITDYDGAQDRDRQLANLTSGQYLCQTIITRLCKLVFTITITLVDGLWYLVLYLGIKIHTIKVFEWLK